MDSPRLSEIPAPLTADTAQAYALLRKREASVGFLAAALAEDDLLPFAEDLEGLARCLGLPLRLAVLSAEKAGERISALWKILRGEADLALVARPLLEEMGVLAPDVLERSVRRLALEETMERDAALSAWTACGYRRTDLVEEPGQVSARGRVVDIWSPQEEKPIRVELDGDRIARLAFFDPAEQRSVRQAQEAWVLPAEDPPEAPRAEVCAYFPKGWTWAHLGPDDLPQPLPAPPGTSLTWFADQAARWASRGLEVRAVCHNEAEAARLSEILSDHDVCGVEAATGPIRGGLLDRSRRLVLVPSDDIFGRYRGGSRPPKFRLGPSLTPETLEEVQPGDYVVHERYGIGLYRGLEKIRVAGVEEEFLTLEYLHGDRLYVPVSDFGKIQRYLAPGPEARPPRLHCLDTVAWERAKRAASASARKLAEDLLRLYAARQTAERPPYPALEEERIFAESFPYRLTPDQEKAVAETLADLERTRPMERNIFGDAGFGKTEVALRAAFRVAMSGKQVAVLVPTTLLAEQHYQRFRDRLADWPLRVEFLSRFQSRRLREILEGVAAGRVDILIGTHRLLSPDIRFRDLGLLIVDEEHRFGVEQKERIRKWKTEVDALSLSATPIPRTLSLALAGLRDTSAVETPPEGRRPVATHVGPLDVSLIRDAILQEMSRGGQVFFIHNRIAGLAPWAERIRRLVPTSRVGIAHGRMPALRLEKTMREFFHRKIDVLVTTAIVESGLDLPNVNTLIVTDSQDFGLGDLYQLRGRVGRSDRRAYAYFFFRDPIPAGDKGLRRLAAIREFAGLGCGVKLAMRDLEIRGAGEFLGPRQHGHLRRIGLELFLKLLQEEVRRLRGLPPEKAAEVVLDLGEPAFLPEEYVPGQGSRLVFYKRILQARTEADLDSLEKELRDRFGPPPEEARRLLIAGRLRLAAIAAGIRSIRRLSEDDPEGPGWRLESAAKTAPWTEALSDPSSLLDLLRKSATIAVNK